MVISWGTCFPTYGPPGGSVGAAVVRTRAGDREVEIYDTFRLPRHEHAVHVLSR